MASGHVMGKGEQEEGPKHLVCPRCWELKRDSVDMRDPSKKDPGPPGWARERKRHGSGKHSEERTGYLSPWQPLKGDVKL